MQVPKWGKKIDKLTPSSYLWLQMSCLCLSLIQPNNNNLICRLWRWKWTWIRARRPRCGRTRPWWKWILPCCTPIRAGMWPLWIITQPARVLWSILRTNPSCGKPTFIETDHVSCVLCAVYMGRILNVALFMFGERPLWHIRGTCLWLNVFYLTSGLSIGETPFRSEFYLLFSICGRWHFM